MKKYSIVKNEDTQVILNKLIKFYGLPKINNRLNIYSNNNHLDINIRLQDSRVYVKYSDQNEFYVGNKSIKYFFRFLSVLGVADVSIGEVTSFQFDNKEIEISLLKNSFLGNLIELSGETNILNKFEKDFNELSVVSKEELLKNQKNAYDEKLFDQNNVLNQKIKYFAKKNGIDIFSDSKSLKSRLETVSNDYSNLELLYKEISGKDLLTTAPLENKYEFKPMSIIIPSFNSEKFISLVLASVSSQIIYSDKKNKIEVIIVDDGSNVKINDFLEKSNHKYGFNIQVVQLKNNMDLSYARNIGAAAAKNDILLFIDADILLSKHYLYEHNIRSQIIENGVFVSMRENVDKNSNAFKVKNILKGLENSVQIDDSRVINYPKKEQVGWGEYFNPDRKLEILDDSNFFKNFEGEYKIGVYDLPSMLSGHNFSLRKTTFKKSGGFNVEFKGWGLEDKFFGVKLVCNGVYIIPVLSANVFHLGYGPREGNIERKINELTNNKEIYDQLLKEDWDM